jgi:hypothetical protein
MSQVCHGEDPAVAGDVAIHPGFSWIAAPDRLDKLEALSMSKGCVGLAMTMRWDTTR